jgi:iron(II)-dependent oxidoreductase
MGLATVAAWHKDMQTWRDAYKKTTKYSDEIYADPQLTWTQTSYMQPQMHPYDLYFYDRVEHKYTVQKWLDDVKARYGGVDSILMWPTCE